MGLFDIFTPTAPATPTPPAVPATPTPPGNIPDPNAPVSTDISGTAPNGIIPAPVEPAIPETPLDKFKDLWETPPVDPNAPAPPEPLKPLSAEDVQKAVSGANFTDAITPENLAAITAGGEDAQQAFQEAMNAVAKQVMVQSTLVNNKLTEQAVAKAIKSHTDSLPDLLREQGVTDHMNTSNPLFKSPAVKPIMEATRAQLLQKFPNATASELTKMTQDYIVAMGEAFAPTPITDSAAGTTDWEAFLQAK